MKDYRLREIKAICKKMQEEYGSNACDMCENLHYGVEQFCIHKIGDNCPCEWDIEPRDMIELPCKIATPNDLPTANWQVIWRTQEGGCIGTRSFSNETDADVFLAYLKRE